MVVSKKKTRFQVSMTKELLEKLDSFRLEFNEMSRSDFLGCMIELLDMGECTKVLKGITKRCNAIKKQ